MSKLHIKKGDTVYVNAGEDKGKTGRTGQHLLHDLHGGVIRDAQTVGEMALHAHLLEHLIDGGAVIYDKKQQKRSK